MGTYSQSLFTIALIGLAYMRAVFAISTIDSKDVAQWKKNRIHNDGGEDSSGISNLRKPYQARLPTEATRIYTFNQLIDHDDPSKGTFIQRYQVNPQWYAPGEFHVLRIRV